MDSEETAKILMIMASVYPNFKVDEVGLMNTTWHALLKELDYKHASEALFKLLKVMKYPPTPADIIEKSKIEKLLSFERQEGKKIELCGNGQILNGNARMLPTNECQRYNH